MDDKISEQHFDAYVESYKHTEKLKLEVVFDTIEEKILDIIESDSTSSGGSYPTFGDDAILYEVEPNRYGIIRYEISGGINNKRLVIKITIDYRTRYFSAWVMTYIDTVVDRNEYLKRIAELHKKYFPNFKADYDQPE